LSSSSTCSCDNLLEAHRDLVISEPHENLQMGLGLGLGLELKSDLIPSNIISLGVFENMLNLLWLEISAQGFLEHYHQSPLLILY
jgi:hypothetical protein